MLPPNSANNKILDELDRMIKGKPIDLTKAKWYNCPGRTTEDPRVKAKKKAAEKSQRINRKVAKKKRKFTSHHKKH